MDKLIIVGAGGFGREVLWLARETQKWAVQGFLDDGVEQGADICGVSVLGASDSIAPTEDTRLVLAINSPKVRESVSEKLKAKGWKFATLVHPSVMQSQYVTLGEGSIITAGNILTTQIVIGRHVILNLSCTVGHDAQLSDFATVNPQVIISGNVEIGCKSEIGTGAIIRQGLKIGPNSMVGMGAVVTKDVKENTLVFGSPAKFVKNI